MLGRRDVWVYCASSSASVALQIESMGYGIHGHDVEVKACLCSSKPYSIDIQRLKGVLDGVLKGVDHSPLWRALGKDNAMIEDLLLHVYNKLEKALSNLAGGGGDVGICMLTGRTGAGTEIILKRMH